MSNCISYYEQIAHRETPTDSGDARGGMRLRTASRLSGCSFNTVTRLLVDAGRTCQAYHDEHVRGLTCKRVQCDEIWSFIHSKAKKVAKAKAVPEGAGDVWTWTAIDADN